MDAITTVKSPDFEKRKSKLFKEQEAFLSRPNERIEEAITLNDENSHGVIIPVGDGSIAIVGAREEQLEDVQKQILQSVTWET